VERAAARLAAWFGDSSTGGAGVNAALRVGEGSGEGSGEGRCERAWRERPYRETLALRAGHVVTLRPAHRSDAGALQHFFSTLTPRSRLLRFHGTVNQLPDTVLRAFTTQVARQHVALVAVADTHDGPPALVAEARYVADAAAPGHAEFALAVADGWQGLGLGRALLQRLAAHAASEGLGVLRGSVMAGNEPMLGLLRGLGASFHSEGSEVHAALLL
jgi:GNAT superfamily N-acetyltransferase